LNHASRSVFRKHKLKERRLRSIAAALPNPPARQWGRPKEALGQNRFEDKPAAARSLESVGNRGARLK
jgi:hypothetical protein